MEVRGPGSEKGEKMSIVNMETIQKQVTRELTEGYRSALRLIAREVITASKDLAARTHNCREAAELVAEGAKVEDVSALCHDVEEAAKDLRELSEALKAVFLEKYPEDQIRTTDEEEAVRWFDDIITTYYHRQQPIIREMTSEYQKRVNCIVENGIKNQLFVPQKK
jgi:hypothetical protein